MPAAARFPERREEARRERARALVPVALAFSLWHCASARARSAPRGKPSKVTDADKAAMARLGKDLKARIVWSTSRTSGKHDIFIMNADGSDKKRLTKSDNVDWFPRFSPDGRRVLFTRSKLPWTSEANCNRPERWNIHVIDADGTGEKMLAKNASWADWTYDGKEVIFARGYRAFALDLASGKEEMLLDGKAQLKGALLQQPQPSPDGGYLAITLRGRRREIGIWNRAKETWARVAVGGGCQMSWFPSGDGLYWVNLTGNRGTEIFRTRVEDGRSVNPKAKRRELAWVDLPGRRSHEYFPRVSRDGKWLVWCATDYGHDHDIYDYEVYCWRVGRPIKEAVRLTFHSGNDRWPDIFVPGAPAKFVILDPTDGTVDNPVTVTVQMQDQQGNVVTTYETDVTLDTTGAATGGGVVDITSGVGTLDISDTVPETVTLSLTDSSATGLDVTSTQAVVFALEKAEGAGQ